MEKFGALVVSFIISYISIPSIISVANLKHLFDDPEDFSCGRKIHKSKVPTLGGVAIFAGFLMSLCFFLDFTSLNGIQYIILAATLLFFTGVKDDILILVPKKKLISQIIASCIVIYWGDVRLESMYGLFGVYEIPIWASYTLTLISMIGIINSFNLIDGIDMLAGTIGLITIGFFGVWFTVYNHSGLGVLAFSLFGSIVGFLFYNRSPAKIFMGDTGAMIIGLVSSVLAIKFIEFNRVHTIVAPAPCVALGVMIIPVFDTIRVMILRIYEGRAPFSADNKHIHYVLLNRGFGHTSATMLLALVNVVMILLTYNFNTLFGVLFGDWGAEFLFLMIFTLMSLFSFYVSRPRKVALEVTKKS